MIFSDFVVLTAMIYCKVSNGLPRTPHKGMAALPVETPNGAQRSWECGPRRALQMRRNCGLVSARLSRRAEGSAADPTPSARGARSAGACTQLHHSAPAHRARLRLLRIQNNSKAKKEKRKVKINHIKK